MLKRFLYFLLALLLIIPLSLVLALYLAVDEGMKINRVAEITPANIERAREILRQNDPRKLKSGQQQTIAITQEDLDLTLNYLVNRFADGGALVALNDATLAIDASMRLPANPIGKCLNIEIEAREDHSGLSIERLRIGSLPVPAWMANWLIARGVTRLQQSAEYSVSARVIKRVNVHSGMIEVTYEWQEELPDKLRRVLIAPEEQERLHIYHARLVETCRSIKGGSADLSTILLPLFSLSRQRSTNNDAAAENRSAILVLATYVAGRGFHRIVPASQDWPQPMRHTITLDDREDLAKHFMVSAAIASQAGRPLSDAIGLHKELSDARVGSGFSFNDLCADRAGTRFGERATGSASGARELQLQLFDGGVALIPSTRDLPEFMTKEEFSRRFGGIGDERYEKVMNDIERRLTVLPLYR